MPTTLPRLSFSTAPINLWLKENAKNPNNFQGLRCLVYADNSGADALSLYIKDCMALVEADGMDAHKVSIARDALDRLEIYAKATPMGDVSPFSLLNTAYALRRSGDLHAVTRKVARLIQDSYNKDTTSKARAVQYITRDVDEALASKPIPYDAAPFAAWLQANTLPTLDARKVQGMLDTASTPKCAYYLLRQALNGQPKELESTALDIANDMLTMPTNGHWSIEDKFKHTLKRLAVYTELYEQFLHQATALRMPHSIVRDEFKAHEPAYLLQRKYKDFDYMILVDYLMDVLNEQDDSPFGQAVIAAIDCGVTLVHKIQGIKMHLNRFYPKRRDVMDTLNDIKMCIDAKNVTDKPDLRALICTALHLCALPDTKYAVLRRAAQIGAPLNVLTNIDCIYTNGKTLSDLAIAAVAPSVSANGIIGGITLPEAFGQLGVTASNLSLGLVQRDLAAKVSDDLAKGLMVTVTNNADLRQSDNGGINFIPEVLRFRNGNKLIYGIETTYVAATPEKINSASVVADLVYRTRDYVTDTGREMKRVVITEVLVYDVDGQPPVEYIMGNPMPPVAKTSKPQVKQFTAEDVAHINVINIVAELFKLTGVKPHIRPIKGGADSWTALCFIGGRAYYVYLNGVRMMRTPPNEDAQTPLDHIVLNRALGYTSGS